MTYNTNERLARYQDLAHNAYLAGFTSEAKRKEALDFVSRAYEIARSQFGEVLRVEHPYDEAKRSYPAAYLALSDVAPYGLHQWRPKHAAALAGYPGFVAKVESLVALREGIKGQTLVAKQPKPKTAAQLAKEATQMTCQICGRGIFAEGGVIAHHGYERPGWGYQTASCEGARALPFEVSKVALVDHIASLGRMISDLQRLIGRIEREEQTLQWKWTSKERLPYDRRRDGRFTTTGPHIERSSAVTRETFAEVLARIEGEAIRGIYGMTFDTLKAQVLAGHQQRLAGMKAYLAEQIAREVNWAPTHRAGAKGEKTWVAL